MKPLRTAVILLVLLAIGGLLLWQLAGRFQGVTAAAVLLGLVVFSKIVAILLAMHRQRAGEGPPPRRRGL